eukprot:COSAG01_NODE_3004_length_6735_cov_44.599759_2_plen_68_part_00
MRANAPDLDIYVTELALWFVKTSKIWLFAAFLAIIVDVNIYCKPRQVTCCSRACVNSVAGATCSCSQ